MLRGKFVRKSLKTRNWEAGAKLAREMEEERDERLSVAEACDQFIAFQRARNLRPPSLYKYELLVKELKEWFCGSLEHMTTRDLVAYQSSWKMCPESRWYKLSRLRMFFRHCTEQGWITGNPARGLARPIFQRKPVVPFTPEEIEKILWATEVYPDSPKGRRRQMKAFVLVLRYTGLRIGDVVALRKDLIRDGKLCLRTAKTGTQVWIPLKDEVKEILDDLPCGRGYFFFSGNGTLKSSVSSWHRSMITLFKLAGVKGHPHLMRHTFSIDLLSRGVSIENVSALLGHQDIRITQKYYASWIPQRQSAPEAAIEKAWALRRS
jgi:integrase/recombinase XerD